MRIPAAMIVEPGQCRIDDGIGRALRAGLSNARAPVLERYVVVVFVEALIQPIAFIEYEGGNERGGGVPFLFQPLGQCVVLFIQAIKPVVAHAEARRVAARENRGVGRQRERNTRDRVGHAHTAGGQRVQVRCFSGLVAVAPDAVGPRRIERDQDDIAAARGAGFDRECFGAHGVGGAAHELVPDRRKRDDHDESDEDA